MKLILPSAKYQASYCAYITELGDEERYPFPLDFDHHDFGAMLARIEAFRQGQNLPEGYAASTTYWLIDQDELIGVSNLRHYLTPQIEQAGGHIGLGIRPSRRGLGLGKVLLKLTLEQALQRGIHEVHIHCEKGNLASAAMILANGGNLHSEITDSAHPSVIQRFRIRLAQSIASN
ncbi:GNAT family N-acetyltransferase [Pseudidiomarina sp.]|uniref:GNAT family N-acetyltransferase n=1 Tax=Pseudidiomarina sp. TaxID=2081707 RepID=UPI003A972CA9